MVYPGELSKRKSENETHFWGIFEGRGGFCKLGHKWQLDSSESHS